jgi:hypothetical protein
LNDLTKAFPLPKRTPQRTVQKLSKTGLLVKHGSAESTWYEATK